jgi:hypothetical protein
MYHQGQTKESSFTKAATTYGMNYTYSESAQMDFSEGAYRLKKESRLLKYATHHHMEVIWGLPYSCKNLAKWIFLANYV